MKDLNFIIFSVVFAMSIYLVYRQMNLINDKLSNLESNIKQLGSRCDENEKQIILVSNNKLNKTQNIIKEVSNNTKSNQLNNSKMDKEIDNLEILSDIDRDDTDNIESKYNKYLNDEKYKEENNVHLEDLLKQHNCLVFTKNYCSYCTQAINYLNEIFTENNLDINELKIISLDENNNFKEKLFNQLKETTQLETVPNIFINKKHIGGFLELKSLEKNNLINLITNNKENLVEKIFLPNEDYEEVNHLDNLPSNNKTYESLKEESQEEETILTDDEQGEQDDLIEVNNVENDNNELSEKEESIISDEDLQENNLEETENNEGNEVENNIEYVPNLKTDTETESGLETEKELESKNKLTYEELSQLTLRELRNIARERCLPTNRNKEPLIQCLLSS